MAIATQVEAEGEADKILQRPDAAGRGGGGEFDFWAMDLMDGNLLGLAQELSHHGDEVVGAGDFLAAGF